MTKRIPGEHHVVVTAIPQDCSDEAVEKHFDKEWHGGCGDVVRVVRPYGGRDPSVALVLFKNAETADNVTKIRDHAIEGQKVKVQKLSEPFAEFSVTLNTKKVQWGAQVKDYLRSKLELKVEESSDGPVMIKGSYWQVSKARTFLSNPDYKGVGEDTGTPTASPRKKKTEKLQSQQQASGRTDENVGGDGSQGDKPGNRAKDEKDETRKDRRGGSVDGDTDEFEDAPDTFQEPLKAHGEYKRQSSSDGAGANTAAGGVTKTSDETGTQGQGGSGPLARVHSQKQESSSGRAESGGSSTGRDEASSDKHRGEYEKNSNNLGATGGGYNARSWRSRGSGGAARRARDDNEHGARLRTNVGSSTPFQSLRFPSQGGASSRRQSRTVDAVTLKSGISTIKIYKADITKDVDVDAIVSPVGSSIDVGGGVAKAIRGAAGYQYGTALSDLRRQNPNLRHEQVVSTLAYDLNCNFIFHIRSPDGAYSSYGGSGTRGKEIQLERAITAILKDADKDGNIFSVAIPAIGTGDAGIPARSAAPIIVETAYKFQAKHLQEIHLVDFNDDTAGRLKWVGNEILRKGKI